MKRYFLFLLIHFACYAGFSQDGLIVKTADGSLEGVMENGVRTFKGIPYAQPPVGELRWKDPQPVKPWKGTRNAGHFGNRAMQRAYYRDMRFRSDTTSEDCLYLNIWTNAKSANERLPVLVYFHGGGFSSGEGSEFRYDGASMAKMGVVTVTVNYRLGIFGFFAHPDLSRESSHHSSGNYGLLDQRAALLWVKKNIAAFGGDPSKVTIAGQSAGSIAVSAHMASPLSKELFRSAIGQSGSILAALAPVSLQQGEQSGVRFSALTGAESIAALRRVPAPELLNISMKDGMPRFGVVVDKYFLPQFPMDIYSTGLQADIPLLAGWTSAEVSYHQLFGKDPLTADKYKAKIREIYRDKADDVLRFFPSSTNEEMLQSATDLASDRFIAYSTWKWLDLHAKTSGSTVYRYLFAKKQPASTDPLWNPAEPPLGAPHSFDIEYALGNLYNNNLYQWKPADDSVSHLMLSYFANFIRSGNPNGPGLPQWPGLQASIPKVMVFADTTRALNEKNLRRYVFLDQFYYR